jgi:hypothetical protein
MARHALSNLALSFGFFLVAAVNADCGPATTTTSINQYDPPAYISSLTYITVEAYATVSTGTSTFAFS